MDHPQETSAPLPAVAHPDMGDRLLAAWADGTLVLPLRDKDSPIRLPGLHKHVLPASLSGAARASLAGIGERFAAWRLAPSDNASVIVRIPHVGPDRLQDDLVHEVAALTHIPSGVGPEPIAVHDDPDTSPIGVPYVVTTDVPGHTAPPSAWTPQWLSAHARRLAHLHTVPAPGRAAVQLGEDPWATIEPQGASLLDEVSTFAARSRELHGPMITAAGLEPFLDAMLRRVAAVADEIAQLDGYVLAHGDLCATNVLWERAKDEAPVVRFIDFEWAQGDDPARDLANIGGAVHGGPWYVPMDEPTVDRFVRDYVEARRVLADGQPLPGSVSDLGSLRRRMRAWTAYERTAMLLHVRARAAQDRSYLPIAGELHSTLGTELDL